MAGWGPVTAWDRAAAEPAVLAAVVGATGVRTASVLPPPARRDVGVVAVGGLSRTDGEGVDWTAFAADVRERTGARPVCVERGEVTVEGGARVRALLVVLDVPGVDEDWRYDYGNLLP